MNGWRLESALPLGRVCRGLDVGGLVVAAVFELPTGDAESLSGASLRLAEDLVARSRAVDLESWVKTRTLGDRLKDQFSCWILSRFDPWATRWIARDPR